MGYLDPVTPFKVGGAWVYWASQKSQCQWGSRDRLSPDVYRTPLNRTGRWSDRTSSLYLVFGNSYSATRIRQLVFGSVYEYETNE